jgi:hypothetical protein
MENFKEKLKERSAIIDAKIQEAILMAKKLREETTELRKDFEQFAEAITAKKQEIEEDFGRE